ncbi:MAG: hypothetical protein JWP44_1977 [Mucilaginibacter sp.]|nr:hypothetical protein [Mucilaginibacter sp.]
MKVNFIQGNQNTFLDLKRYHGIALEHSPIPLLYVSVFN